MTGPIQPKRVRKKALRVVTGPMGERYRVNGGVLQVSSGQGWSAATTVPVSLVETLDDLMKNPEQDVDVLREELLAAGLFTGEVDAAYDAIRDAAIAVAASEDMVSELVLRGARVFPSASMASNALGSQLRRVIAL